MNTRESIWRLLSDLFVDTTHTDDELRRLGIALKETRLSVQKVERILRCEVAPVCGRWMLWPGAAVGPWPQFDKERLEARIREYVERPWYKPPLFRCSSLRWYPGVRRAWSVVKDAMKDSR